jgi:hypothetical protein
VKPEAGFKGKIQAVNGMSRLTYTSKPVRFSLSRAFNPAPANFMTLRLGIMFGRHYCADTFWNQCEGALGRQGDVEIALNRRDVDHLLVFENPGAPDCSDRYPQWKNWLLQAMGHTVAAIRARAGWEWLGLPREKVTLLFYEPPNFIKDGQIALAHRHAAAVYGPDRRCQHPIRLPVTWNVAGHVKALRAEPPGKEHAALVAVTSGKLHLPGHKERMAFFQALRDAGVDLRLFGRNLPMTLEPGGQLMDKGSVLRPARFALAIENHAGGDLYVTEKIWDALLCWCLPLYYGSGAAEKMIPPEAFVRLPDLGARGIETVKQTMADPGLWERRLDAIAEARRRILGPLRLVEWMVKQLR